MLRPELHFYRDVPTDLRGFREAYCRQKGKALFGLLLLRPQCLFLFFLFQLFLWPLRAEAAIEMRPNADKVVIGEEALVYRDVNGSLTIHDILDDPAAVPFDHRSKVRDKGYRYGDGVYWLAFSLSRAAGAPQNWWMEVGPAVLDEIAVFVATSENRLLHSAYDGTWVPFSERQLEYRYPVFKLALVSHHEEYKIYVRVKNTGALASHITLWSPSSFVGKMSSELLIFGIFFGLLLGILILNLTLWRLYRPQVTFWWMVYLVSDGLVLFSLNGFAPQYLFPQQPQLISPLVGVALSVQLYAAVQFMSLVFGRKPLPGSYVRWFHVIRFISVGSTVLSVLGATHVAAPLIVIAAFVMASCALIICIARMGRNSAGDRWYCAGCILIWCALVIVAARYAGLLELTPFSVYVWEATSLCHLFLISYGTVQRYRFHRRAKLLARRRMRNARAAAAAARLREELVAIVLHEMRAPLTIIHTSVSNLRQGGGTQQGDLDKRYQKIWRAQARIKSMIENYLSDERMKRSYFEPIHSEVDMAEVLADVVQDAREVYPGRVVELSGIEGDAAGNLSEGVMLSVDRELVRIALANVIDNALKYSSAPAPVLVHATCSQDALMISVRDQGIGIAQTDLPKIFERYYRAPSAKKVGAGLGLHIVKIIMEQHGGEVTIKSAEGVGTEITLTIPRILQHTDDQLPVFATP